MHSTVVNSIQLKHSSVYHLEAKCTCVQGYIAASGIMGVSGMEDCLMTHQQYSAQMDDELSSPAWLTPGIAAQRIGVPNLRLDQPLVVDVTMSDRDVPMLMPAAGGGPCDDVLAQYSDHQLFSFNLNSIKESKIRHAVF